MTDEQGDLPLGMNDTVTGKSLRESRPDLLKALNAFQSIKDTIGFARVRGQYHDGKVPIRELYPLVVLVRQSYDSGFLMHPDSKSFSDYSMAQFVYDFARAASKPAPAAASKTSAASIPPRPTAPTTSGTNASETP